MVACEKCGYGELTIHADDGCRWQCDYCHRIYEVFLELKQFGDCDDGKIGKACDCLHPAQFKEPEPKVIPPFHCSHCEEDVSDVRCYALGKNMTPEKCRGCPQLCQGMDYGEEWVGCHANPKDEGMIHG